MLSDSDIYRNQFIVYLNFFPEGKDRPDRNNISTYDTKLEPWVSGRIEQNRHPSFAISVASTDKREFGAGLWLREDDPLMYAIPDECIVQKLPFENWEEVLQGAPDVPNKSAHIEGIRLSYQKILDNYVSEIPSGFKKLGNLWTE